MYNKVIMLGRVASDLELKTTPSGTSVCTFSIAVDRRYQVKGEEKKSDFFNCVAWRNEAEFITRFWVKGKPILVEGELQNRSYVDRTGSTRYVTEIIVDRACFTGDGKKEEQKPISTAGMNAPSTAEPPAQPKEYTAEDFITTPTDDDYPF